MKQETMTQPSISLVPATEEEALRLYQSLVEKIAFSMARRSRDPAEDLVQVGLIALIEALRRYDKSKKASFKTYATHYISGHIRHYLRDKQQLLRGPRSLQELSYRVKEKTRHLKQSLKREPNHSEIAQAVGIDAKQLEEVFAYQKRTQMLWLDKKHSPEQQPLIERVNNDGGLNEERLDNYIFLKDGLAKLSDEFRALLELRYFNDLTQAQIAEQMGMTQMEVCRKLKRAEKKLKEALFEYVD